MLGSWDDHPGHAEHSEDLDAVWKGLTALAGVYFMFLIEHFLTLAKIYKDKKQKVFEVLRRLATGVVSMATRRSLKAVCLCPDPEEVGSEGQTGSREAAGSGGERLEAERG